MQVEKADEPQRCEEFLWLSAVTFVPLWCPFDLDPIVTGKPAMTIPVVYQIRVKDHLGEEWTAWFDPFVICNEPHGEATLTGPVRDQAELLGLLLKLQGLNLTLLAVNRVESEQ